jgi:hypothetical protein
MSFLASVPLSELPHPNFEMPTFSEYIGPLAWLRILLSLQMETSRTLN